MKLVSGSPLVGSMTPAEMQREIVRLQEAKRRALAIADERSKENVKLRADYDELKAADRAKYAEIERLTTQINLVPSPAAMLLQARPADGGAWVDIFPAQLGWMAKEGFEVRALDSAEQDMRDTAVGKGDA